MDIGTYQLINENSKLLTFNSPFGRYSFCRLPYGIHSASEIFQAQIAKIVEGTKNYQDDILIWSETLEDYIGELKKSSADYVKMV